MINLGLIKVINLSCVPLMDISSLNSASLRSIISLVEKRDKLVAELVKIESAISSAFGESPSNRKVKAVKATSAPKPRKRKRGAITESIVAELKAAGKAGVVVKNVAAKLGVKPQNIHVWIHTTGKKLGVRRIGPGTYAL